MFAFSSVRLLSAYFVPAVPLLSAIEYRENENEIISIGVPIYNSNGELLAAMTFITLASLFDMETLPEISGALIKQASKVSSALC